MRNCTIRVAKTKALIGCAVTAQLICVFVFACADRLFSQAVAYRISTPGWCIKETTDSTVNQI